jgi:hypothetical protein
MVSALPREERDVAQRAPAWMENLVEVISECVEAQSPMGPLGYRYLAQGDPCELLIYPTPVELVGGAEDGAVVIPGFSLDLHVLLAHFDQVEACQWSPHGLGPYDPDGPCVSIEGLYQGHDVWLRVLAEPPEEEEPGLRLSAGAPL